MGYVDREMARLEAAIANEPLGTVRFKQLFAARQALSWAADPLAYGSPMDGIDGITRQSPYLPPVEIAGAGLEPATPGL